MPVLNSVTVGQNPSIIYGSQGSNGSPLTVTNLDPNNTVYVGNQSNIMAGATNSIPLLPRDSMSFDGSVSVYAVCAVGLTVLVAVTPGGNSFSPGTLTIDGPVTAEIDGPVTIDGPVSVQGIGGYILPGPVTALYQSAGASFTVAGKSTRNILGGMIDVSQYTSYDLNMCLVDTLQGSGAGHALNGTVTVSFYDDLTSGIPIFAEIWNPWVITQNNGGLQGVIGSGPMRGLYMTLTVQNNSNDSFLLQYCNVFGSGRNVQLSDWRQSFANHVNDSALHMIPTNDQGYENSLADTGQLALAASTGYFLPFNMYSGPAMFYMQVGSGLTIASADIIDIGTSNVVTGSINGAAGLMDVTTGGQGSLMMPRSACGLRIVVGSGTGGNFAFKLVGQQGP